MKTCIWRVLTESLLCVRVLCHMDEFTMKSSVTLTSSLFGPSPASRLLSIYIYALC